MTASTAASASATRRPLRSLAARLFPSRRSLPQSLAFFVTERCDMRCRHCFSRVSDGDELSCARVSALAEELGPLASISLSGGEPFVRSDLGEIVEAFARHNPRLTVTATTNGFNTRRITGTVERIMAAWPDARMALVVSLDGFAATHDALRGTDGAFEHALATAGALLELRERYGRPGVSFQATLSQANYGEVADLAAFVRRDFGIDLKYNVLFGQPRDGSLRAPALAELRRAMTAIDAARGAPEPAARRRYREVRLRTIAEERQVVPCHAGRSSATVQADGDVQACFLLPPIGNLHERSFREIWHGAEAKRRRRAIRRGQCWCHADCYIAYNLSHHWSARLRRGA
jgi:radical SAM protein with 4Fe4S-binding SPASM domain